MHISHFLSLILPYKTQLEALPSKPLPTGMVEVSHKAARLRQNTEVFEKKLQRGKEYCWLKLG